LDINIAAVLVLSGILGNFNSPLSTQVSKEHLISDIESAAQLISSSGL